MTQQSSSRNKQANINPAASREGQSTGPDATREMAGQVKETVGQVTEQAQQAAGQVASQARQQVSSRLAGQKDRAAEGLTSLAHALRQTSQQLRQQDQQTVTGYIEGAASQVERVSNYLKQNDLGGLIDDVEQLARRQPALFLGGTFVLGLLGARFLKSSRPATSFRGGYPGSTALAQRGAGYPGGVGTRFPNTGTSYAASTPVGSSSTWASASSTPSYPSENRPRSGGYQPEE